MSVGLLVETPSSGFAAFVVEGAVIHELFIRLEGSASNTCASYVSPFQTRIRVGVRDLPDTLQFVQVHAADAVARAFGHGHLQLRLLGALAQGLDRIFQAGSALTKWLLLVKFMVIRPDPWICGPQCKDDDDDVLGDGTVREHHHSGVRPLRHYARARLFFALHCAPFLI